MYIILAFIVGIIAGYEFCQWLVGRGLQSLIDQGQAVVRTEDGWQGDSDALASIAKMAVKQ